MESKMTCYKHPERETVLRCNRCEKPICNQCAVRMPTGYRCKECIKSQQKVYDTSFNTATTLDYVLAPLVTLILTAIASYLSMFLGFYIILAAPVAGWLISALAQRVVGHRRSRLLFRLVGAAFIVGSLILPLGLLLLLGFGAIFSLLWPVVFGVLVTVTGYSRFSGIVIKV